MRKVILFLLLVSYSIFVSAQELYHTRDIKPNMSLDKSKNYTLDILNGLSFPQGTLNDFLKDGFTTGLLIHKRLGNKFSVGLSAHHTRYRHKIGFGVQKTAKPHELRTISFDIGPRYNLDMGLFTLEFYGRSGLSIVNSPQTAILYPETNITITTLEAYKNTALTTRLGANMTATISKGLNLYLSSEYITSLNRDISYITRDLEDAFGSTGSIDTDVVDELPYKSEKLTLSMLNVNLGVRISLGGNRNRAKSRHLKEDIYLSETYSSHRTDDYQTLFKGSQVASLSQTDHVRSNTSSLVDVNDFDEKGRVVLKQPIKRSEITSIIVPDTDDSQTLLSLKAPDFDSFVKLSEEKRRYKSKAQLAKERRQKKRTARKAKRLRAKCK